MVDHRTHPFGNGLTSPGCLWNGFAAPLPCGVHLRLQLVTAVTVLIPSVGTEHVWPAVQEANSPRFEAAHVARTARFETLDDRRMLSISFVNTPSSLTVEAGAPLPVALNTTGGSGAVSFSYNITNNTASLSTTNETANTTSAGTPNVIQMSVSYAGTTGTSGTDPSFSGTMTFQLYGNDTAIAPAVAQFESLVSQGFYNSPQENFFRVIPGAIQGGDPTNTGTGGSGTTFNSYYDQNLRFTAGGMLAMANSGPNTNSSQFFVTTEAVRQYDFQYTIVGFLTSGNGAYNGTRGHPAGHRRGARRRHRGHQADHAGGHQFHQDLHRRQRRRGALERADQRQRLGDPHRYGHRRVRQHGDQFTDYRLSPTRRVGRGRAAFLREPFSGVAYATENTTSTYQIPAPTALGGSQGSTVYYAAVINSQYASDLRVNAVTSTGLVDITSVAGFTGTASMTVVVAYSATDIEDAAYYNEQVIPIDVSAPGFTLTGPSGATYSAGQNVTFQWTASPLAKSDSIDLAYAPNATAWSPNATWIGGPSTAANGAGSTRGTRPGWRELTTSAATSSMPRAIRRTTARSAPRSSSLRPTVSRCPPPAR